MTEHDDFLFFELQGLTPGKPFPGFAPGTFVDMMGREIELKAKDMQDFITNTLIKIVEFKSKGMPGLPIDARKHDKGDAAGWIVGAELGEVTDSTDNAIPVIRILAEWTKIGTDLIRDKVQTNFSPTVDLDNKTLLGGSLTNWPASVDANGIPLFTAVELAQGIHYLSAPTWQDKLINDIKGIFTSKVDQQALMPDIKGESQMADIVKEPEAVQTDEAPTVDLSQLMTALDLKPDDLNGDNRIDKIAELVKKQSDLQWQARIDQMERKTRVAELSIRLVGGSEDAPRGIPIDVDVLAAELAKLEPEQEKFWGGLCETIVKKGLSDFSEVGHNKKVDNLKPVPDFAVSSLKAALAAGNSADEYFELAGLGNADEYDLTPFEEKE